jgi:hypothetical protein
MLKMLCENAGKPLRCPSDQIGNLPVANFDDAKLTIGPLHNIHGVEPAAKPLGAPANDWRHIACLSVRRGIENEVTTLSVGQKALDATHTKATLNDATKTTHVCNDSANSIHLSRELFVWLFGTYPGIKTRFRRPPKGRVTSIFTIFGTLELSFLQRRQNCRGFTLTPSGC